MHYVFFNNAPNNGDKIKSSCLTPTFSGAHKWARMLRNPCILRRPQQRGQNHWLHVTCFCIVDSC